MANYSFGDIFAQSYQNELSRQQQERQFQQQFGLNQQELSLLDAFRNKQFNRQGEQFDREFEATLRQRAVENDLQRGYFDLNTQKFAHEKEYSFADLAERQRNNDMDYKVGMGQVGLGYANLNQNKYEFDTMLPIQMFNAETRRMNAGGDTDKPLNLQELDIMMKEYYGLPEEQKAGWRSKAYKEVDKLLEESGIGQSAVDALWNNSGIQKNDSAVTRREKLKAAIDFQKNRGTINPNQAQVLYKLAEVRTR
jgi:hypothetical protein